MSTLHKEINFENDLCNHLSANGCGSRCGQGMFQWPEAIERGALNLSRMFLMLGYS